MSVLIKGIEMPEDCFSCPLKEEGFCNITNAYAGGINERNSDCPLVELPETHGRLVDADKLMAIFSDRLERVAERYGIDSSEAGILSGAMKLLESQTAIIEAEGV